MTAKLLFLLVLFVLGVAQPLQDDLLGGGRGDPSEPRRGVVVFPQCVAIFVGLCGPDGDVAGGAVELDASVRGRALRPVIGDEQRVLDGLDDQVERDVLLAFEAPPVISMSTRFPP